MYPAVNPDRFGLGKGVDTGGPVHQGMQRSRMPGRTARQMGTGRSAHLPRAWFSGLRVDSR